MYLASWWVPVFIYNLHHIAANCAVNSIITCVSHADTATLNQPCCEWNGVYNPSVCLVMLCVKLLYINRGIGSMDFILLPESPIQQVFCLEVHF